MANYIALDKQIVDQFIKNAIAEDVGDGDHTSLSTIPQGTQGRAKLIVKEKGILAGVELALEIFQQVDSRLKVYVNLRDGEAVSPGDIVLNVHGSTHSILLAERLVLNCMQ
ncbi:MAG: nicotinate-nucleotide diphosphorylase, partial [Pedobacter sp.]